MADDITTLVDVLNTVKSNLETIKTAIKTNQGIASSIKSDLNDEIDRISDLSKQVSSERLGKTKIKKWKSNLE